VIYLELKTRALHVPTHPSTYAPLCASQNLPERLMIESSHTFAGTRVPAAATGPPPSSSPLRRFSKPGDLPRAFSESHGSSPCSTWLSPGLSLAAVQFPAVAPPLLAGDSPGQSTATNRSRVSPIDDPCRLFVWPSPTSPPASWFPPSRPRGRDRGYFCEDFKSLRVRSAKRFFLVL
jgi:hypothetical protein